MDHGKLRQTLADVLGSLTDEELELVALGVFHGVPIRQLVAGGGRSADDCHAMMIGALKRMRTEMETAGFGVKPLTAAFVKR